MEAFDLPAGLRVIGPGVTEADTQVDELELESDPATPPRHARGNTAPLSDNTLAGTSKVSAALRKLASHIGSLEGPPRGSEATARR